MKKTSLLIAFPLGAALLYLGSTASTPPNVERRPATLPEVPVPSAAQPDDRRADLALAEMDIAELVAGVDYLPARYGVLETVLEQGTVGERKAAVRELRHLATEAAAQTLSIALGDNDPRVRNAAFEALSQIGGDAALVVIASATADPDPALRMQAIESLGAAGGYSAADYLERALQDDDARVRAMAVLALGDLDDSDSVNIMSRALRDPDVEVRERALEMLDELNDDALFRTLYPTL